MPRYKIGRLGLVGHVTRMEEERIRKRFLMRNVVKKRPVGKPRTRWEGVALRDTSQILGIRG